MTDRSSSSSAVVGVVGLGAVGARTARALVGAPDVGGVVVRGVDRTHDRRVREALGDRARPWGDGEPSVVVLATPAGTHVELARDEVARGRHVVSVSDDPEEVEELVGLRSAASDAGVTVVRGAAMSPGLTCVLARHAASLFDHVSSVDVTMLGAAGPACVERRARSLVGGGAVWRDGRWQNLAAGAESELVWFPDPIGARDCSVGALAEPFLLREVFPPETDLRARAAVEPAERWLGRLMPKAPVPHDHDPGACRVEVVGHRGAEEESVVYAVMDRPSLATAIVASVLARRLLVGDVRPGVVGTSEVVEPVPFLAELARLGVRAATFERTP